MPPNAPGCPFGLPAAPDEVPPGELASVPFGDPEPDVGDLAGDESVAAELALADADADPDADADAGAGAVVLGLADVAD